MKKNIKKIIPAVIITSMLGANPILAEELDETVATETQEEQGVEKETEETSEVAEENSEETDEKTEETSEEVSEEVTEETEEVVDETEETEEVEVTEEIEEVAITVFTVELIQENGRLLFPVRTVFENLGFEVNYEPVEKLVTLSKGAQYITFNTTKDGYTIAKTAPQLLGQAPVVKSGSTYAPVELLTEIAQLEGVTVNGLELTVAKEVAEETVVEEVTEVTEVAEEVTEVEETEEVTEVEETTEEVIEAIKVVIEEINEEENRITINDPEMGTVILNIEGLEIEYTTEDTTLMVGQTIEVVYSDIMLTSEPPVNIPVSVKVVSAE